LAADAGSSNNLYVPEVGFKISVMIPRVVVFPLPFGPSIPKTVPCGTEKFTFFNAWIRPYVLDKFSTVSIDISND